MKYKKEVVAEIIKNIEIGLNQEDSAQLAGISHETFYQWKKNKPDFLEQLNAAALRRKKRNLAIITKAGITHWQAAAWDLERRYRAEFASWFKLEHSGPGGGPITTVATQVNFDKMDEKTVVKLVERLDAILRPQSKIED